MALAFDEARLASDHGDVPVGAVVVTVLLYSFTAGDYAAALDVARWPDDALALRLAPDEALVITASIALDLDALSLLR